ncbi:MAG: flagellar basal body-associated FliL family protein [Sphingobium sp.]|nr:flagellar basal body-associated FliL family protein [Sphingobium sp.]MCP5398531.1 flagellar basal body-associated FliL family protein [Sphingomonas sp.]
MATKKKPQEQAPPPAPDDADDSGIIDLGPDAPPIPAGKFAFLKNKKLVIGALAALLLLGGGGGAAMFLMGGDAAPAHSEAADNTHAEEAAEEEAAEEEEESSEEGKDGELPLVDVPPMVVNMRSADGTARYLKLRFMLEAKSADKVDKVKAKLPAIIDAYQPFLRELRPEDISGSAAVFRIKEEMLVRAIEITGKGMVKDVLIQDLVQQ